jgi:hypothetical protein
MAMSIVRILALGIGVLAAVTGCAGSVELGSTGGGALSAPAGLERQVPDCRNRGVYNRAANLCVSEGG